MRFKQVVQASSALAALALSATVAHADPDGWYGAVDAGYQHTENGINAESTSGVTWDWEVNNGWAAFARVGYRFNPNWRVELEAGHRSGDIGTVRRHTNAVPSGLCNLSPSTGPCHSPEGSIKSNALMLNAIYDFDFGGSITPFVGLGVGVNQVSTKAIGNLRGDRTAVLQADDSSTEFALQGLAGLAWAVNDRTNVDLTYRYLTGDSSWDTTTTGAPALGTFEGDYDFSHTLTLGLRYAFSAPAAPPPPPPPPPPPYVPAPPPPPPPPVTPPPPPRPAERQFVVYFEWDRSDLTADAQAVVRSAADYAKSGRPTRVVVVGHADTSGSQTYNQALSARRSRTVSDALVAQGVAGSVISMESRGETQLAKPTADGVREPLNRRATININF